MPAALSPPRAAIDRPGVTPADSGRRPTLFCAGQAAYAPLAPSVFDAADQGDAFARALLQQAADEWVLLVHALQEGPQPLTLVLGGSGDSGFVTEMRREQ